MSNSDEKFDKMVIDRNHYSRAYGELWGRYEDLAVKHGQTIQTYSETCAHLRALQKQYKALEDANKKHLNYIDELRDQIPDYYEEKGALTPVPGEES